MTAQQDHHRVCLGWDEAKEEDVATATVVTLQHRLPQGAIFVQRHLFGLGSHQVVDDVAVEQKPGHVNQVNQAMDRLMMWLWNKNQVRRTR